VGKTLNPQQKAIRKRATDAEYKSGLIRLESRIQEVNPREAARIIARLELWQNTSSALRQL